MCPRGDRTKKPTGHTAPDQRVCALNLACGGIRCQSSRRHWHWRVVIPVAAMPALSCSSHRLASVVPESGQLPTRS
jgi:hypothetical protein